MVDINNINKLKFLGFSEINVSECLKMIAIISSYRKTNIIGTFKNTLVLVKTLFFKKYQYKFEIKVNSNLLFVYSDIFFRKDSLEKFMKIATLRTKSDIVFPIIMKNIKFRDIKANPSLKLLFLWIKELSELECAFQNKLRIVIQLTQIYQFLNEMKRIEVNKYNLLTVYFDASPQENALVQFFRNHGIKTATLQHGMFISERNVYDPLYSGVELKSFSSDYFLAWNEFTKKEMLKTGINEDKIKVLGIPKYVGKKYVRQHPDEKKIFGVVLDVPQAKKTNKDLIKYANSISEIYDLKYKVKYHPNSKQNEVLRVTDPSYYIGNFDSYLQIEAYKDQVDFTLIGASSVFIELVIMQHPTFRLTSFDKYDKYLEINENAFDGIAKFLEIFENKALIENNISVLFDNFFVEDSLSKYVEFFKQFD